MIYCLSKVRNKGFGFLATAFGLTFISSLSWSMVHLLKLYEKFENYRAVSTILGQFTFVAYVGFALFYFGDFSNSKLT